MKLSAAHERYLLRSQILVPAAINVVANALVSYLVFRGAASIRYWDTTPVGPDLLATGFLLPFIVCMIQSRSVAASVRAGTLAPVIAPASEGGRWHRLSILTRSLLLGAAGVLLFAVPTVLLLPHVWPEPLGLGVFVIFKAIWSAVLAVIVSPVIAVWAMRSAGEGPA